VVHEEKLSSVLTDFAHTMATDFPIQAILNHLVKRIVEVLPVTSAGVTLISGGNAPHYIAASDENALRYEQLQTRIGQGPCLASFESGIAVSVADLGADDRFPRFANAAIDAGLRAAFAFPLRHSTGRLGALDLYRTKSGPLGAQDMAAAQTLADVAAAYLVNAQGREDAQATSEAYQHSALHDPLTGLPNRSLFLQRLDHAALRARRSHTHAAILFADLDRFKAVNDTYGHGVGDELLIAVAERLQGLVRPGDTLARFSGDEFVFLCEDMDSTNDVEQLAGRIDASFATPFTLADVELAMTASVGVAFAGPGREVSSRLVADADVAMYQAKRKGGAGHQILDLREALETSHRNSLDHDLRSAFAEDKLSLVYQPIVRSTDDTVAGVEALLRWEDPVRGSVSPLAMVEAAEQSGLIIQIGSWVLDAACRDHARWRLDHPGVRLDLAVNVSPRQLIAADFCATVADTLASTDMAVDALVLEVTESILINEGDRAISVLTDLKNLGVRLALDDFGTGFSSLSYLRRMPIDIVKIDQSFIADIKPAAPQRSITAAITNLAHVLGLSVTAEGVETDDQREGVRSIGCESAQGFLYAHPMSAVAIGSYLNEHQPTRKLSRSESAGGAGSLISSRGDSLPGPQKHRPERGRRRPGRGRHASPRT
jgi:diguanylate cyclase (GGDEF)-like protein